MRIQGILLPSDWNDEGQVTALILATSEEEEIPIQTDRSPAEYKHFYRRKVTLDGERTASGLFRLRSIGYYAVDLKSAAQ